MAEAKTKPTKVTAKQFIATLAPVERRADAETLVSVFQRATGEPPVMWGPSIIGFGQYHYTYESGREGDMCLAGFSPRSSAFVLYVLSGAKDEAALLGRLGKHTAGKGCLYVKRVGDVDLQALEALVRASAEHVRETSRCDKCVTERAERRAERAGAAATKPAPKATARKPRAGARAEGR